MTAYRIERSGKKGIEAPTQAQAFQSYLDRLLKMIPAEVVALYLVGSGVIPAGESPAWLLAWSLVCLLGVVVIRAYGTADRARGKGPQWAAVLIATISFVIWLYSLGGPFKPYGVYKPFLGSLLILAWTFFVPIFYHGD